MGNLCRVICFADTSMHLVIMKTRLMLRSKYLYAFQFWEESQLKIEKDVPVSFAYLLIFYSVIVP